MTDIQTQSVSAYADDKSEKKAFFVSFYPPVSAAGVDELHPYGGIKLRLGAGANAEENLRQRPAPLS